MRRCIVTLIAVLLATTTLHAQTAAWRPGGPLVVNGKPVAGATFLESGRRYVFPVLALAQALGRKATVDLPGAQVTWEGKAVALPTLVAVDGVAYVGWRDLARLEPQLEYGIASGRAEFSLGRRSVSARPSAATPANGPAALPDAPTLPSTPVTWFEDFAAAQKQARAQHRLLLVAFVGSDWCSYCQQLEREVLNTKGFQEYADPNLVLMKVDFPRTIAQSETLKQQNRQLRERFAIEGFPTLIILNADGNPVGKVVGRPEGGLIGLLKTLDGLK